MIIFHRWGRRLEQAEIRHSVWDLERMVTVIVIAFTIVDIIYIIANFIGVMIIKRMMRYFFDAPEEKKLSENIGYTVCYLYLILAYFSKLHTNLYMAGYFAILLLITLPYRASFSRKLFVAFFSLVAILNFDGIFLILCRSAVVLLHFETTYYVWSVIASKLALWTFIRFLAKSDRGRRASEEIPRNYGILLVVTPALSLHILSLMAMLDISSFQLFLSVLCIVCINLVAFVLYDNTVSLYEVRTEKEILAQRTMKSIEQLDIMSSTVENLRIFRHDIVNHFMVLRYYIEKNRMSDSLKYLEKMEEICRNEQRIKSGNAVIDSMLNYKISEAARRGIEVEYEVEIPEKLLMEDFDLTCILGNLLDNAVEAAEKTEEKFIGLKLKYREKGVLFFKIQNTFSGDLIVADDTLMTTKEDRAGHGFGLISVRKSIQKYDGIMRIRREGNIFGITVLLRVRKAERLKKAAM